MLTQAANDVHTILMPQAAAREAFSGLAGRIVETISPHTESDPIALLLQLLAAFGNLIGGGPHWRAEADHHALKLFIVLVGDTAKARKGTSWSHIRSLVGRTDPTWESFCIQTGLSSGEGLIHAVRDGRERTKTQEADAGCLDPRLCVVESEFAGPLRMITRDGNVLSSVVRQAWDGPHLQVLTRQAPIRASHAHVSIIAHITREELLREIERTDVASGFGNRFIWAWVRRSKLLPDGGTVPQGEFDRIVRDVDDALNYAKSLGDHEFLRDAAARELWHSIYRELSEGRLGIYGAVTSRAEAQVMRLACLYALLDKCSEIRVSYLQAALALWKYCDASANYIFRCTTGNRLAELILDRLIASPVGLTRTQINNALGRNYESRAIEFALSLLQNQGFVTVQREITGGRDAQRWHVVKSEATTDAVLR